MDGNLTQTELKINHEAGGEITFFSSVSRCIETFIVKHIDQRSRTAAAGHSGVRTAVYLKYC